METLFMSTSIVAIAEMGDKTQLLSFVLAAKFKNQLSIILGILFATLANHFARLCGGLACKSRIPPDVEVDCCPLVFRFRSVGAGTRQAGGEIKIFGVRCIYYDTDCFLSGGDGR